jgi:hypothetical protein
MRKARCSITKGHAQKSMNRAEGFKHSDPQAALAILWLSVQDARTHLEFGEATDMEEWAVDVIPAATFLITHQATPQQLHEAKNYVVGVLSNGSWSLDAV